MKIELQGFAREGSGARKEPVKPIRLALVEDRISARLYLAVVDKDGAIVRSGRLLEIYTEEEQLRIKTMNSISTDIPVETQSASRRIFVRDHK